MNKNTQKIMFLVLIAGIVLISGCTVSVNTGSDNSNNANNNAGNNVDNNLGTVSGSDFEFIVPSELPIAYVGRPYLYSFCNPEPEAQTGFSWTCGVDVTPVNPSGGTPPYEVTVEESQDEWYVDGLYNGGDGLLNFTAKLGDEGQYVLNVCARDTGSNNQICKNTTLYIMSDTVTVKGEGNFNHSLLLKINSIVKAADFAGNQDEKNVITGYVAAANFTFDKVTSSVPASPSGEGAAWQGGGSSSSLDVTANENSVSVTADGNAPCGQTSYYGGYQVDYYMVGYVGYNDNLYLALSLTNTGTMTKAVDIYLNVSSELDARSAHYFDATANAVVCVGSDNCVEAPTGSPGAVMKDGVVYRVLVRPGNHWISIGSMNNRFANTNMITCPSFVQSSSTVSVIIVPADMNDGKRAIGTIYSYRYGTGTESSIR
ncbi:Uncharacterised protein [Candidatus Tiddalikarchaeum anstoanum]|nr:Uncharacterised protein [Candidatus Tiddalikarchaeum anstoanum]